MCASCSQDNVDNAKVVMAVVIGIFTFSGQRLSDGPAVAVLPTPPHTNNLAVKASLVSEPSMYGKNEELHSDT